MNRLDLLFSLTFVAFIFSVAHSVTAETPAYKNPNLPVEQRLDDLIGRMTLDEKVAQMCQYVGLDHMRQAEKQLTPEELHANDALGFYPGLHSKDVAEMTRRGEIGSFLHVLMAEEANQLQRLAQESRLGIPLLIGIDAIHGNALVSDATVYPTPIGIASTWDEEIAEQIGIYTAREMRATGSHWAFTPNIDVARDGRWGRVGETFGEDPLLVTRMGVATIRGMQQGDYTGRDKVIACAKHLIAGSEPSNGLNAAPMDVSVHTLRMVHLPPYRAAVAEGVFTVMAAHNEINGVPCHGSRMLMTDILRGEYGFDGFYVSDWMDIERMHNMHKVVPSQKEACFLTVDSGMDMHMHGPGFHENIVALVQEGRLSEKRIDESARKILEAKIRLGLFEQPLVDIEASKKTVFKPEHCQLALDTARRSITLLKNDGILPLPKGKYRRILVTGPNAQSATQLGDWAVNQPAENITTVVDGISALAPKYDAEVDFVDVGDGLKGAKLQTMATDKIAEAIEHAKSADLAIVVVGENSIRTDWNGRTCGENKARADLQLPGNQKELVEGIFATGTPTIAILVNGRPLAVNWMDEHLPAIVEAWEPGSFGGQALAEILFGEVNPSGHLPITFPRSVGQLQMIYNHKPSQYFHKYVFSPTTPLYPFGHGLSYTTFEYSNLRVPSSIRAGVPVEVSVDVTNTGNRSGEDVVLLYVNDVVSSVTTPVRELEAYGRVDLAPDETKTVQMTINPDQLALYDIAGKWCVEPGRFDVFVDNLEGHFVVTE